MSLTKLVLNDLIQYREHQITSKTLTRKLEIKLPFTAYAMDAGESISQEQSSLTRLIQVVDGVLTVTQADKEQVVSVGELVVIPAGTLHALVAQQQCQFIQFETK